VSRVVIRKMRTWVVEVEARFKDGTVIADSTEVEAKDLTDLSSRDFEADIMGGTLWTTVEEKYDDGDAVSLRIECYLKGSR
jgi:hypothetical protein